MIWSCVGGSGGVVFKRGLIRDLGGQSDDSQPNYHECCVSLMMLSGASALPTRKARGAPPRGWG